MVTQPGYIERWIIIWLYPNFNSSQPQPSTTINKRIAGQQQAGQPRKQPTVNQQQQAKPTNLITPPSTERPGPEGEADEEEPSEVCYTRFSLHALCIDGCKI